MNFLHNIRLIQGGMGVYISNWRLARAVAQDQPGITAGTVSGTGLDVVYTRILQLGDSGGHARRALQAFDAQFGLDFGQKIIDTYFIPGGKAPDARYKMPPPPTVQAMHGGLSFPKPGSDPESTPLAFNPDAVDLLIATSFAEVWLAKQGHTGRVFINFMNKVELPLVYGMYGAMLAGVDAIIVGAGNPEGLPAVCSRLANHQPVSRSISVLYRESGESFTLPFDPQQVAGGKLCHQPLERPAFLAIVSLEKLVQALAESPTEPPDGFILEHHTAGGHNAGPQGPLKKDEYGQPVYGPDDEPDLSVVRQVGKPFWLAGGYGSRDGLQQALSLGATGVQVGSAFALAQESGLKPAYRSAVLEQLKNGAADDDLVRTTLFSPTGFPFKVFQLEGTLADEGVYADRRRVCDLGLLQVRGLTQPDAEGNRRMFQRCPAAPIEEFVRKRGLAPNAEGRRCLCNGLLASAGLGQMTRENGEEPAIITLGNHLQGIRRLSSNGQSPYWAGDVIADILGD